VNVSAAKTQGFFESQHAVELRSRLIRGSEARYVAAGGCGNE
jgi:hypothetical protein